MKLYGLFGTGGCARDTMPLLQQMLVHESEAEIVFVDTSVNNLMINGCRVLTDNEFFAHAGKKYFNVAISNSIMRENLVGKCLAANAEPFSIFASNHLNLGFNQIAEGAIFSPFTLVNTNLRIGKYFHANMYSYIAHDCIIGDYVTFAPRVHCNGNVVVEDHAYIGAGAIIKQGKLGEPLVIGRGAVIGMGAVVTKSVAPNTTVIGNPAKPLVK